LHLVGILFPNINDDAGQNHIKFECHLIAAVVRRVLFQKKKGQFRLLSMYLAPSSRVSFEICCITPQRVIKSSFRAATRSEYTGHSQQIQIRCPPCQLTMVIIDTVGGGDSAAAAAAALDCLPDSWFAPLGLSAHFNFPP